MLKNLLFMQMFPLKSTVKKALLLDSRGERIYVKSGTRVVLVERRGEGTGERIWNEMELVKGLAFWRKWL